LGLHEAPALTRLSQLALKVLRRPLTLLQCRRQPAALLPQPHHLLLHPGRLDPRRRQLAPQHLGLPCHLCLGFPRRGGLPSAPLQLTVGGVKGGLQRGSPGRGLGGQALLPGGDLAAKGVDVGLQLGPVTALRIMLVELFFSPVS
jgi:hypothetical protein